MDVTDFTASADGDSNTPDGTNGSYSAVITLAKGNDTGDIATSTYAEVTVSISGTITAEPYEGNAAGDYWLILLMMYNQQFDITAAATEGGAITPTGVSKVKCGKNITYTITPDDGCMIADVLVDGKSVGAVSEYTFKNIRKNQTIEAIFERIPWQNPYSDVSAEDWFYEGVQFVSENKLMIGTAENELFTPDATATRAMIVTILWRMESEPVVNYLMQFDDIEQDEWYSEAVRWASSEGIVLGNNDGLFHPEKQITREQLAAILHRYAAYKGTDTYAIFSMLAQYEYSLWAENDVIWAETYGLFDGIGSDMNDMTAEASRAEVAAMLRRFFGN